MNETLEGTAGGATGSYDTIQGINEAVRAASGWVAPLRGEIGRAIVGQGDLVNRLLVALLADGHVLLEGVPGLAKTLTLKTLSEAIDTGFQRIQFTPDMLPADIIGTEIYRPGSTDFVVKKGPVFSNLILADEINRAPSKVQSALLEAMQERQVTIGETTHVLPVPFLVLATQNPIEQEGTYTLPEAQLDRFMLKVVVGHPSMEEERMILDLAATLGAKPKVNRVVNAGDILKARQVVNAIHMDDRVKDYIVKLVVATREPERFGLDIKPFILNGASPRATINLTLASKAVAFLEGRGYVTPQDVKTVAMDVMRHRVSVTYEAEAEELTSEDLVGKVLETVPVP
ncbi:MAG: MoxR family ATPase [Verrucomicrobiales bacterium]|nr:MoxR family ATPase [Verrucomicrobiales bacterium]